MSWVLLLLAAWIAVDLLIVGAIVGSARRRLREREARKVAGPRTPQIGARPTSPLVH